MKVVTTPMSKGILEIVGIEDYIVNAKPDSVEADIVICLSESKVHQKAIKIKLNTFAQLEEAIQEVYNFAKENNLSSLSEDELKESIKRKLDSLDCEKYLDDKKKNIAESNKNVLVFSEFLSETVNDMGYNVFNLENIDKKIDFIVYSDYLNEESVKEKTSNLNAKYLKVPSHKNVERDPFRRICGRYKYLEDNLK